MYNFRGYSEGLKKWIFGTTISQTSEGCAIRSHNPVSHWITVKPETLGIERIVSGTNSIKVYPGDIVKYTFVERKELYNRYYVVKDNDYGIYLEEAWRDYRLYPDTFDVERCECFDFKGSKQPLDFHNILATLKVVGNIWNNPELAKI